ncbi:hypothetical protein RBH89_18810 [Paracidovorax avenae]
MTPLHWLLLGSMAGNGLLGWAWLGERDAVAAAQAEVSARGRQLAGAQGAAQACNAAVDALRIQADQRAHAAAEARRAAAARAQARDRRADDILARPMPVPGDACASAQARVRAWLQERSRP